MAEYDFEQDGPSSFDLEIEKQNFYLRSSITDVEKNERESDLYPNYVVHGHNGTFRLEKTAKDLTSFTTSYILVLEGGPATAEIGIPEDFAKEIIRKITEVGLV